MNYWFKTQKLIESFGFKIVSKDFQRPWGGFLVINENQAQNFSNQFFKGIDVDSLKISEKLSPKILIVKPMLDCHGNITTEELKFGEFLKENVV